MQTGIASIAGLCLLLFSGCGKEIEHIEPQSVHAPLSSSAEGGAKIDSRSFVIEAEAVDLKCVVQRAPIERGIYVDLELVVRNPTGARDVTYNYRLEKSVGVSESVLLSAGSRDMYVLEFAPDTGWSDFLDGEDPHSALSLVRLHGAAEEG